MAKVSKSSMISFNGVGEGDSFIQNLPNSEIFDKIFFPTRSSFVSQIVSCTLRAD